MPEQRDQTRRPDSKPESVVAIIPASAGLPTRSWWIEARTWGEFSRSAQIERQRMTHSKFGRTPSPTMEG
jgi:hypothetical protein